MPLYLIYLQMPPETSDVMDRNKSVINADYTVSNVTVSCFTPVSSLYDIQIDAEVSRFSLDFRYGLYDNLEMGFEVPYVYLSSGYLDNFVESFEDAVGATTPRSRERQGSNNFAYAFRYNNEYLIQKNDSTSGLGDASFNAKYQVIQENAFLPNLSLRSAIKLPTGDKDSLLGSGKLDYGLGILVDKSFFSKLFIYSGFNVVFIKKPAFFNAIGLDREIFSAAGALEYFLTKRMSFVAQFMGNSTPYPDSGTNALDNYAYDISLGINYTWREKQNISWHIAVTENANGPSSPDASIKTGLRIGF